MKWHTRILMKVGSRPVGTVAAGILLTLLCGLGLRSLKIDHSLSKRFSGVGEGMETYRRLTETFGSEAALNVVVLYEQGTVWDTDRLDMIRTLSKRIEKMPEVTRVTGITSPLGISAEPKILKAMPLIQKLLVSADQRVTAILIEPEESVLSPQNGLGFFRRVERVVRDFKSADVELHLTGPLALQSTAMEYSQRDLLLITSVALSMIVCLLTIAFQSIRRALVPVIVAAASCVTALGIISGIGIELSQSAFIAVPVLIGLSVLDGVHIVHAFSEADGERPKVKLRAVLDKETTPCFWTSLTTLIGFAAVIPSPLDEARTVGLVMAFGVPISFIASFTLLPTLIAVGAPSRPLKNRDPFEKLAKSLSCFTEKKRKSIVVTMLTVTALLSLGMSRLTVKLDFPNFFRSGDPLQRGLKVADQQLKGAASMELLLDARKEGGFKDPATLKRVASLSMALNLAANVRSTVSLLDVGLSALCASGEKLRNRKLEEVLDSEAVKAWLNPSSGPSVFERWVTPDFKTARVHLKLKTDRPDLHERLDLAIQNLAVSFADWFDVVPTGFQYMYKSTEKVIFKSFLQSFLVALLGIGTALLVMARRLGLGVAGILANICPLAAVLGVMGFAGVPVSMGLLVMPAVGLGLVADDTVHFLMALKRSKNDGRQAVEDAFESSAWPIVLTQAVLIISFGTLTLSYFAAYFKLGILMPLFFVMGLAFDLLFVPAFIMCCSRKARS